MEAGMRRKGMSMPQTPRPVLERSIAIKNPSFHSDSSSGRHRDRHLTPSNSAVSRHDEDWVEFSVHGKPDIQEMSMMLREIGLSPIELGIPQDDWNRVKQGATVSPQSNADQNVSTSAASSSYANGEKVDRVEAPREEEHTEDIHRENSRSPLRVSRLGEEDQRPRGISTPAERTRPPVSAPVPAQPQPQPQPQPSGPLLAPAQARGSGPAVATGNIENGRRQAAQAQASTPRGLPSTGNHPVKEGDGSGLRCASLPTGIELCPKISSSQVAAERQPEAAVSPHRIERSQSEPLSGDLSSQPSAQTSPPTAPPAISNTLTNGKRKQPEAGPSRPLIRESSLSMPLKPPPGRSVMPVAPKVLSTEEMINSLAPDAVAAFGWNFSDSDGEKEEDEEKEENEENEEKEEEEEKEEVSSEQSAVPTPAAEVPTVYPTEGAEVASGGVEQPDEPKEEILNETDGEVQVTQVGGTLTVEPTNGNSSPMNLKTISESPRNVAQPKIPRTSSLYTDGPKRPWNKGNKLGAGTFGTVYGAIDSGGMFFAVKEVSIIEQDRQALQAVAQLKQELELLKRFKHDNIVQYLGTEEERDKLYIFLEYVELGSLASVYKNFALEEATVSKYTRDILRGLEYLHNRNVLHRDVKCANVLVDKSGTCKLADFGMAKQISSLNLTKSCMGSAYWMAPEVINPNKTYGLPCDIWSLGCSVLEMATRAPPFGEMEWYRAMFTVGRGNAPPIPEELSDSLRDFVRLCFEIDPMRRPTATELLHHPFIWQGSGAPAPAESSQPYLSRSETNLQPITEERSSDFSSQ